MRGYKWEADAREWQNKAAAKTPQRRTRPTFLELMLLGYPTRDGVFALDAVTATAVLRAVERVWQSGMLHGEVPSTLEIGKALRRIGCQRWQADYLKVWIWPDRDLKEVCYKGGTYWCRRIRHYEKGGLATWEPEPLQGRMSDEGRQKIFERFHARKGVGVWAEPTPPPVQGGDAAAAAMLEMPDWA